ncbi:MAG: tetratricopeptide repeat protein, partial [Bradyrhizobium guangdongense]
FVFEMPDGVGVSSIFNEQKLTLAFNAALNIDLADAIIAAPSNVASIKQKTDLDQTTVEFVLIGESDVHNFRDDKNYVIDVAFQPGEKKKAAPSAESLLAPAKPATEAKPSAEHGPKAAAEKPKEQPQAQREITPPTSETIAREAKIDVKPVETKPEQMAAAPATEAPKSSPPATEPGASRAPPATEAPKPTPLTEAPKPAAVTEAPAPAAPAKPMAAEAPKEMPKETAREEIKEPVKEAPKSAATEAPAQPKPDPAAASVEARRDSDGLRVLIPLSVATPAAAFRRGDTVWLVFDSTKPIDFEPIRAKGGAMIGEVSRMALDKGQAVRIRPTRPLVYSLTTEEVGKETNWLLTLADKIQASPLPLMMMRNITDPAL